MKWNTVLLFSWLSLLVFILLSISLPPSFHTCRRSLSKCMIFRTSNLKAVKNSQIAVFLLLFIFERKEWTSSEIDLFLMEGWKGKSLSLFSLSLRGVEWKKIAEKLNHFLLLTYMEQARGLFFRLPCRWHLHVRESDRFLYVLVGKVKKVMECS